MIAILGASGQVGSALLRLLADAALPVSRSDLDLEEIDRIGPWLRRVKPDAVINCAAYTAVDAAEVEVDLAYRLNAEAVSALARDTAEVGARFVTFSTDYVFDGTKGSPYVESDAPNPLNVYGASKAEGERLALEANPDALVIRTSWVMSSTHHNFIRTMIRLMHAGPVSVVDDQRGRPTFAEDLAPAVLQALKARVSGLLHLTNQGETTWFHLAQEIAELSGLDAEVNPIPTKEAGRPAARPADSRLDSERTTAHGLTPLPHYRPTLERAVEDIMSEEAAW